MSTNWPTGIEDQLRAQEEAQWRAESSQAAKEFARYKQDCRKRALDLAHGVDTDNVLKNADKYYSWLISIPEK